MRRFVTGLAGALALACAGAPHAAGDAAAPHLDQAALEHAVDSIAAHVAPAPLGVGVYDFASGESWTLAGDQPFMMQSVFKAPLGVAVLHAADHGLLRLDSLIVLTPSDLSAPFSAVADSFPARTRYTVDELLERAVGTSDNVAADVLMRLIGGPAVLTRWLRGVGIGGIRVDRYEREIQPALVGLGDFRPGWKGEAAFARALNAVPAAQRRAATRAGTADPRDTLTPQAALAFLRALADGRLVPSRETRHMLDIMSASMTGMHRLRAGLPDGATLAHKTGSARTVLGVTPATNDIGIVTLANGRRVAVAVLLGRSTASDAARDAVHAAVARAAIAALR